MKTSLSTTYEMVAHFQQWAERDKAGLARELHDELGGLLIGAVMDLDLVASRTVGLDKDTEQRIGRARHALGTAIEFTRRITEELRPTLLDNVGLFSALRWQLRNACARTQVRCTDALPETEPLLTPRASIALFRIVQEALIIGLERPGVTEITLVGKMDDSTLALTLGGDGVSVPEEPNDLSNLILESIRHRVRALGGTVSVRTPVDEGIILTVTAPLENISGVAAGSAGVVQASR